ncbi:MAG: MarR family transcriptional regulator [Bacteroidales bacterium]|nr:MarR family transcriptional regulator [Bacteroidales bacterium]
MYEQLKLEHQLCFRLYSASRLLTQAYRPLLEPHGLTYPQYLVMMALWEQDHQTVSDLCRRLMLESNTLTPLLQRMEREGIVIRSKGISDGRQTLISLSPKGRRMQEQCKDVPSCVTKGWLGNGFSIENAIAMKDSLDELIAALKMNGTEKKN